MSLIVGRGISRWREVVRSIVGGDHVSCGDQRSGGGGCRIGTLVNGRAPGRDRGFDSRFLDAASPAGGAAEERMSPVEYKSPGQGNPSTGSSGVAGIQTVVLKGDPNQAGVYTIMLRVPPHTRIAAHSHRNDRVATAISGTWHIGYGDKFDEAKLKALPPGSFYTEPPSRNHFAETGDEPVVVQITGYGPSSTTYVESARDPRNATKPE